jgi:hypothetical protein
MILSHDKLKAYVEQFNARDNELYANTYPNAKALDFLAANIPLFECPEPSIEETYYFRWWTYRKHLRQTPDGWVVTEFLPDVCWASKHNAISCAAGHHLYEGRWLRDPRPLDEYAAFWLRKSDYPEDQKPSKWTLGYRSFSSWLADAVWARYCVTGDPALPRELLPDLIADFREWEKLRREPGGLFWQVDTQDGMEFMIGGSGRRPSINSYMYGNLRAIAAIARLNHDGDTAAAFTADAERLRRLVQETLWDDKARFFKTWVNEEGAKPHYDWQKVAPRIYPAGDFVDVRELIGFIPWYFNLPEPGFEDAWAQLLSPHGFLAPFGPTTAEQRHPHFRYKHTHDCMWNGESWPFATAQTLTAMANLLNNYDQAVIGKRDYLEAVRTYARSHRLTLPDGSVVPWSDENLDPFTGEWRARVVNLRRKAAGHDAIEERGKDYNHSTFCDLIISGLCGLRPGPDDTLVVNPLIPEGLWDWFCLDNVRYHGRDISIFYDADGSRYGKGSGLRVLVDGRELASQPTLREVRIPLNRN